MNKEFIDSIYEQNQTTQGRENLYKRLETIEEANWKNIKEKNISNWTEIFTQQAKIYASKTVIKEVETGDSFSYQELEDASNSVMNFILATTQEHQLGINYHNSFDFIATLIGINKAGRLAILFNNREPNQRLESLAQSSETKIVFGNAIKGLKHIKIREVIENKKIQKNLFLKKFTSIEEPAFVIFTSGTSGPSKPALFSHKRMIGAGVAWSLRTGMDSRDSCYISLPLYHGNALAVAFSSVIYSGATAILRPKFSVRAFWNDINKYNCSHMVYIGELWRYLLNNKSPSNPNKSLKVIFGNGLNHTLWKSVLDTYKIEHVVEHFGATEMPSGALTNWMNIIGYCGYLPLEDVRVQEMVLVDENFKSVEKEENGEALFLVPSREYRGYLDKTLDAPKLHRNLFEKDDVWWKSGDLLRVNSEGFYTFVERLGDTYRFKGENVACVDVENAIRESGNFEEVVVYGVELPNIEGKVGMASLVSKELFATKEANELLKNLKYKLAKHALPHILRIQTEKHVTTSTLKIQKAYLAKEALKNISECKHYYLLNLDNGYKILESEITLGVKS